MSVMADLAALAYERSSWIRQETARSRIELVLKRAAADVSGSLETEEVLRHVAEHALPAVNADRAVVFRMLPSGELGRAASAPAGSDVPAIDSGTGGRRWPRRVPRPPSRRRWPPPTCRWCWGRACSACCRWRAPTRPFSEDELEILLRLARSSVGAIVNAAHFEQERKVARALTRGFVPDSPPDVGDYELAALYEPAGGRDRRRRRVRAVDPARAATWRC